MRLSTCAWAIGLVLAVVGPSAIGGVASDLYQDDGGSGGDASDTCSSPSPTISPGGSVDAELAHIEDEDDYWGLAITNAHVGTPVTVTVALDQSGIVEFEVLTPNCVTLSPPASDSVTGPGSESVSFTPSSPGTYRVHLHLPAVTTQPCWPTCVYTMGAEADATA